MIVGWMSADLVPQLKIYLTSTLWSVFSVFADLIIGMIISIYFYTVKKNLLHKEKGYLRIV